MKNTLFDVVVSARTDSTRLPRKAMLPLLGMPMILFLLRRIDKAKHVRSIVLATTDRSVDDELVELVGEAGFKVFRGSTENLIDRHIAAAKSLGLEGNLIRVTGDCPLVSAESLDYAIEQCMKSGAAFDVASTKGEFPVGIDYEIFSVNSLKSIAKDPALTESEKEHLTLHFYNHSKRFKVLKIHPVEGWRYDSRALTVDTNEDYLFVKKIVESIGTVNFSMNELMVQLKK